MKLAWPMRTSAVVSVVKGEVKPSTRLLELSDTHRRPAPSTARPSGLQRVSALAVLPALHRPPWKSGWPMTSVAGAPEVKALTSGQPSTRLLPVSAT